MYRPNVFTAFILCTLLGFASATQAADAEPGPLVSAQWLHDNHRDQDLTVIDVQAAPNFIQAHVDGSVNIPFIRSPWTIGLGGVTGMLPPADELANLLKNHGVSSNDRLVVTHHGRDTESMTEAARVYWSLKSIGVQRLHFLDGGLKSFRKAGLPLKQGPQYVRPRRPYYAGVGPDIVATADDVDQAIQGQASIIDARPPEFFNGDKRRPFILRKGHIKGAVNIPAVSVLDPATGRLKSAAALRSELPESALTGPQIIYSDRGISASLVWLALYHVLGNTEAKLYDGSMMDWATRRTR